jgi:hypothetical protein
MRTADVQQLPAFMFRVVANILLKFYKNTTRVSYNLETLFHFSSNRLHMNLLPFDTIDPELPPADKYLATKHTNSTLLSAMFRAVLQFVNHRSRTMMSSNMRMGKEYQLKSPCRSANDWETLRGM